MFAGQCMFFEKEFNIITSLDYDSVTGLATDKLRKDGLCFHTFMLMNIINMINCRVVNEFENNVFKTLLDNKIFWFVFILEMIVQNGIVIIGGIENGPFKFLPKLVGTCTVDWKIHLTAWIFGLFTLAIRPLTNKIPLSHFHFMDSVDLETKEGKNCVTSWSDRAAADYHRMADDTPTYENEDNLRTDSAKSAKKESLATAQ